MSEYELKRFELLAELSDAELEILEDLLEPVRMLARQQVFREGQEADGLLLVHEGKLRFSSERTEEAGVAGPGLAVGGLSLVVVGPREVTAVAEEQGTLLKLTRTAFHRLAEDAPRATTRMLEHLLRDLTLVLRKGLDKL